MIERDYVLAWFLTGLAGHPLREVLAFKGGTALRRCWFEDYRFSEDLDFTLTRPIALEEILAGLNEIFTAIEAACGLRIAFDCEDRHGHQNSYTFYLRYLRGSAPRWAPPPVSSAPPSTLLVQDRPIQRIYTSFDDLPEGPTVKVYALEEIVVEKLLALSDRARNEPRDLYDLWYLFGATNLRIAEMRVELDAKLALRQRVVAGMEQAIAAKEDRLLGALPSGSAFVSWGSPALLALVPPPPPLPPPGPARVGPSPPPARPGPIRTVGWGCGQAEKSNRRNSSTHNTLQSGCEGRRRPALTRTGLDSIPDQALHLPELLAMRP